MKTIALLSVLALLNTIIYAQSIDSIDRRCIISDHRLIEGNLEKEPKTTYGKFVPAMIIILNYSQVINMDQYLQVKRNKDIIKEYDIDKKHPESGEVEKIRIVESKNKYKYKDLSIKE